jgi:hypothetical protein
MRKAIKRSKTILLVLSITLIVSYIPQFIKSYFHMDWISFFIHLSATIFFSLLLWAIWKGMGWAKYIMIIWELLTASVFTYMSYELITPESLSVAQQHPVFALLLTLFILLALTPIIIVVFLIFSKPLNIFFKLQAKKYQRKLSSTYYIWINASLIYIALLIVFSVTYESSYDNLCNRVNDDYLVIIIAVASSELESTPNDSETISKTIVKSFSFYNSIEIKGADIKMALSVEGNKILDPWGTPYKFSKKENMLIMESAGPNKTFAPNFIYDDNITKSVQFISQNASDDEETKKAKAALKKIRKSISG